MLMVSTVTKHEPIFIPETPRFQWVIAYGFCTSTFNARTGVASYRYESRSRMLINMSLVASIEEVTLKDSDIQSEWLRGSWVRPAGAKETVLREHRVYHIIPVHEKVKLPTHVIFEAPLSQAVNEGDGNQRKDQR